MRILSANDVHAAITMPQAIEAMREGFAALSTNRAHVPLRIALPTSNGTNLYMPAYLDGASSSSVKVVSVYPDNARFGLPMVQAVVLVLDAENGQVRAILDGTYLTALRTGAASGLATDLLARADSSILGVIGAGTQARTQIEAICAVRPIREIRVYSRRGADSFVNELRPRYPDATMSAASSAAEALRGADILVAATNSSTPVIHGADVGPGMHINGIGSYLPTMQEIAPEVVTWARIVVDSREGSMAEAGDILIPMSAGLLTPKSIYAELGEIAAGLKPGRADDQEITLFKSVGNAVQDAAVAARVVAIAEAQNLGVVVNL